MEKFYLTTSILKYLISYIIDICIVFLVDNSSGESENYNNFVKLDNMDRGDDSDWKVVRRRRGKSGDSKEKEGLFSFFFRNFLKGCSAERQRRKFEALG